jgi:pyridoxine 4-dehydrogenase
MTTKASAPAAAAGVLLLGRETPVPRMGFGAMQLPGPGVWGPPRDRAAALAVLRRAVELGVRLIDTAGFYGPNVADELIADALHPYPDDLALATKVGVRRGHDRSWLPDAAPASLREQVEASLRRLRTDVLDLVHLRLADGAVLADSHVPLSDSFGALAELRDRGLVRHLGLSSATRTQLRQAQTIAPVAAVQNRFNLADRADEPLLRACQARGIAFTPYFPLARGRLLAGGLLAEVAGRHGATPAQVALAWLLQTSPATLLIPGTSSLAHLEENLAAATLRLDPDEIAALDAWTPTPAGRQ